MAAPFSNACDTEINIRVAYRLIERDWRLNRARYDNPSEGVRMLSWELRFLGNQPLHLVFAAMALFLNKKKGKLSDWCDIIIARARYSEEMRRAGKPWAFLGAPPVSNTGGTTYDAAVLDAVLKPFGSTKKGKAPRGKRR